MDIAINKLFICDYRFPRHFWEEGRDERRRKEDREEESREEGIKERRGGRLKAIDPERRVMMCPSLLRLHFNTMLPN